MGNGRRSERRTKRRTYKRKGTWMEREGKSDEGWETKSGGGERGI
jgi:hypothetical protein